MLNVELKNKNEIELSLKGYIVSTKHGSHVGVVVTGIDVDDLFNVFVLDALHDDDVLTFFYDESVALGTLLEDFNILKKPNEYLLELKDL